jgi:hypothetical protein
MMETTASGGAQGGAVDIDALLHCLTQWVELVRRQRETERDRERQRQTETDRDRQR